MLKLQFSAFTIGRNIIANKCVTQCVCKTLYNKMYANEYIVIKFGTPDIMRRGVTTTQVG